jgi:hypothetical protein
MRKVLAASVTWLMFALPVTAHAGPPNKPNNGTATIMLNGQNIPITDGTMRCGATEQGFTLAAGHNQGAAWVEIGNSPAWNGEPTAVSMVMITDSWGNSYEWTQHGVFNRGDAQYQGPADPSVHSAGSYKITGHVPLTTVVPSPPPQAPRMGPVDPNTAPLEPFEIGATCQ